MKPLIKVILIIGLCFAVTFLLIKSTGVLTIDQIEAWLNQAKTISPLTVVGIVILLLFADLFIAVPTLTVTILSGFFLGFTNGALAAFTGLMLAGLTGYGLSRTFGDSILKILVKEAQQREEAISTFKTHGFVMILLSRAIPILPEVTACLAGMTRMRFEVFLSAWILSSAPYVLIAAYGGSVSSIDNPLPAIYSAIGLSGFLWLGWYLFHRASKQTSE